MVRGPFIFSRTATGGSHWPTLALVAAAGLLIAPLWLVSAPAMPDYPAHLASFFLIGHPDTSRFYHIQWVFTPNLASEVIVPLLARVMDLSVAARLFFSAGVAMWVLGPAAINRALYGRIGIAPLLGAAFAYNANFLWGFFNYYFAAGLSLCVFAAWIATEKKPGLWRTAGFAAAATIVYFCHVFAAASLLLAIACFEAMRSRLDWRDLLRRAAQVTLIFLPAALAFFLLRPRGTADRLEFNLYDTMLDRFESLIGHSFDHPAYVLPIALGVALVLALALRRARIAWVMLPGLAALLIGALVAPEWAMGGWAVHLRLPAYFCALLFASVELKPSRINCAVIAVMLAVLGWNAHVLAKNWQGYDRQFREFQAAMPQIPQGTRLLTVLDAPAIGLRSDQPYWHMAEFSIPARGTMTSLMFTTRGQHVVQLNPPFQGAAAATAQGGSPPDIGELAGLAAGDIEGDIDARDIFPYLAHFQCHYDQALVIHLGGPRTPVPDMLTLRHAGSFFSLYDIRQDPADCPPQHP